MDHTALLIICTLLYALCSLLCALHRLIIRTDFGQWAAFAFRALGVADLPSMQQHADVKLIRIGWWHDGFEQTVRCIRRNFGRDHADPQRDAVNVGVHNHRWLIARKTQHTARRFGANAGQR